MAVPPWDWNTPITDGTSRATPEFLTWLRTQLSQNNQTDAALAGSTPQSRQILAGLGLSGGGNLTQDRTLALDASLDQLNDVTALPSTSRSSMLYKSAGDWVTLPPGTPGQILQTGTASANPSWIAPPSGGGGGGLYNISMGVPDFSTVGRFGDISRFAWTGNGTKGLNVRYTSGGGGPTVAGYWVPIPSGNFHVATLMLQNSRRRNFYGATIGLMNSGNQRLTSILLFEAGGATTGIEMCEFNNPNSRSTTTSIGDWTPGWPVWLHLRFDGTNYSYGFSRDGATPIFLNTRNSSWTGTPDRIAFGGFFEMAQDAPDTSVSVLCYDVNAGSRVVGA